MRAILDEERDDFTRVWLEPLEALMQSEWWQFVFVDGEPRIVMTRGGALTARQFYRRARRVAGLCEPTSVMDM